MASERPYTAAQIDQYLQHIAFPLHRWPKVSTTAAKTKSGLEFLTRLQKYQLIRIPFENLSLHYAKTPGLSLDKDELFEKIVEQGKGGYCMELNLFFGAILQSLGYEVVPTGARICSTNGEFGGWSHQVNLVNIEETVYLVDVGFGGPGPTTPQPLLSNIAMNWGATSAETRLRYQEPENKFVQGIWFYEHRTAKTDPWTPVYCFGMTKFYPKDFEMMSYAMSTRRKSWFTQRVFCLRMVFDEKKDDVTGILFLSGRVLRRRVDTNTETVLEFQHEGERVKALYDYFGIVLTQEDVEGILHTVAAVQ